MLRIIVILILLYILFRKIFVVFLKSRENYNNRTHIFMVQKANTYENRKKGLMFVKKKLGKNMGMLFDYKTNKIISLWMKNTYIPLDAIFMNDKSKVVDIIHNLKPLSKKTYSSKVLARYVLEVNSASV